MRINVTFRFAAARLAPLLFLAGALAPARAQAQVDYQVPSGWSRTDSNGSIILARVVDLGFGVKQDFRLVILPIVLAPVAPAAA